MGTTGTTRRLRILTMRGRRVMLDADLAAVYAVSTKRLNEQVRRNLGRFPPDFMFALSASEAATIRSHSATASRRNVRHRPFAFTEHGAAMLAAVLKSAVAVQASVAVVRAFNKLRRWALRRAGLETRLRKIEGRLDTHDKAIDAVFIAVGSLTDDGKRAVKEIGFRP